MDGQRSRENGSLYELVRDLNRSRDNRVSTVIEGPHIGEKLLTSDGQTVWLSDSAGFFSSRPDLREVPPGIIEEDGVRIYTEKVTGSPRLVICGGGHVGCCVAKLGKMIGMEVTVIDDRAEFADQAARMGAEGLCGDYVRTLKEMEGGCDTYFVIMTRGHQRDTDCLREILRKPRAYVGMIGSRNKVKHVMACLRGEGVGEEFLREVFTPIGLSIGARTPEEIAVSVIAEIIQVKNADGAGTGFTREILDALLKDSCGRDLPEKRILMTIVKRTGSAPREAGAKMVLLGDGTTAGTIGGGAAEARALNRAGQMLQEETAAELLTIRMNAEDAARGGMICGGQIEIFLEKCGTAET